jgi:hypothetical protein
MLLQKGSGLREDSDLLECIFVIAQLYNYKVDQTDVDCQVSGEQASSLP